MDKGILQVACRAIEPDGSLSKVEEAVALSNWKAGRGPHWVDLESEDPAPMIAWVVALGLDPDLIEAIQTPDSTGRVLPFNQLTFFEYPVPDTDNSSALVAGLVLDNLLITFHDREMGGEFNERIVDHLQLSEPTITGLVCAIILTQSLRLRRAAMSLRDRVQSVSLEMDKEPESIEFGDILDLKRRLLDLARIADEQMSVFDSLQAVNKPSLNLSQLAEKYHLALDNVRAADRRLDRLDRFVLDLQRRYESLQQDKMNRRLGFLTIISAVFMPLTLIAGIYGMNFEFIPELNVHYGYFYALGGMALLALLLIWYFRTRDWLD